MRRKITKILAWLAILFFALIGLFTLVLYLNREKIQRLVLTEVNALLEVPVDVESIDVSIRRFPYASLKLNNVYCRGAQASQSDTLLFSRELYFEFDLWNVLSDDLSIKHISLQEGTINILRPQAGIPNYQIWKEDSSSSSSLFTLEKIELNNFKLTYTDKITEVYFSTFLNQIESKGSFSPDNYMLSTRADLHLDSLTYKQNRYLAEVDLQPYFVLSGNYSTGKTEITEGTLRIKDEAIAFELHLEEGITELQASLKKGNLAYLQQLSASQNWYSHPTMKIQGRGDIVYRGKFGEGLQEMNLLFSAYDASLSGVQHSSLRDIRCDGNYQVKNGKDHLKISTFSASGNTGSLSGALEINDLSRPGIVLDLKSDLELSEWLIFIPIDTLTQPAGRAIVDLHFENRFKSLTEIKPEELKRARASGSMDLENISFAFKGANKKIESLNGKLAFKGNDLQVQSFSFNTGNSDIMLDGTFQNVLNFFYFDDQRLRIDTRVKSENLKMEDFLLTGQSDRKSKDEDYDLSFVRSIDLNLNLAVNSFSFEDFSATAIRGQLQLKDGVIQANNISLDANDGHYDGHFTIDARNAESYTLSAGLSGKNIDIHKLFLSFHNFGQDVISADNLYGTANLNLQYLSRMNPNLEIDINTIEMTSNLSIANGNLKNYEPMSALSDYAAISELKDVRFDRLENNISIRNSTIIIPRMSINSNVMDMAIEGTHNFNNNIDYSIKLKLSDVLFTKRKNKERKSEFDDHLTVVESDDDPYIFIKMTGTASDPIIKLDKENIGKSINQDLKQQGKELKNIFKKEDKNSQSKEGSGIQFDLFGDDDEDKKKN